MKKTLEEYFKEHSRKMNKARMKKLSPKRRHEIALKAGLANKKMWANKTK